MASLPSLTDQGRSLPRPRLSGTEYQHGSCGLRKLPGVSFHSLLFMAYYCISCVASQFWPIAGALCYIAVYHIFPERTWWGKELTPLALRYSLIAAVATTAGCVFNLRRFISARPFFSFFELLCLLFLLNIWLSPLFGIGWCSLSDFQMTKMTKVFVFVFLLVRIVANMKYYRLLVLAFVLGALYLGYTAHTAPAGNFYDNRLEGIGGPDFAESGALGIHLAAVLPFIGIYFLRPGIWWKALSFISAAFACQGIVLARGRSAFVGLAAGAVVAILRAPRQLRTKVLLAVTLGLLGGYSLSDQAFLDRMKTIINPADERDASAQSRIGIWRASLEIWRDYPFGIGIGNFERLIGSYESQWANKDSHSSYIDALVELGGQGAVMFAAAVICSFGMLSRCRRMAEGLSIAKEVKLQVYAVQLCLVIFLFGSLTQTRLYCESFWWFMAMPLCLLRSVEHERRMETSTVDLERETGPWLDVE
jgi:putative inorganic carbon (HCO3(-)) transporter